ncbi:hypothetical protein [Pseudomonas fluorescens]|uniref:hypothetical protein n=1 Tax=Pseudomonas fluorescens TaxID=294 RepID=UPI00130E085B|nr:hypothetical protein [Pseudomonas fluorescens]
MFEFLMAARTACALKLRASFDHNCARVNSSTAFNKIAAFGSASEGCDPFMRQLTSVASRVI